MAGELNQNYIDTRTPEERAKEPISTITTASSPIPSAQNAPGEEIQPQVAPEPIVVKETPKRPGRPTKKDPIVIGKLEQAFALDSTVDEACFYAGIHRDTYYAWCKDDPELSDRMDALRNTPILAARQKVVNDIKTNPESARWYLERKRKKEFGAKIDITSDEKALQPSEDAAKLANLVIESLVIKNVVKPADGNPGS